MKRKIMVGVIAALSLGACISVYAAERQNQGRGNVTGMVQFFTQDIMYLEREVDGLMAECGKELME